MTEDLHEADTGGPSLVFASDATGVIFRIRSLSIHDPEEVREQIDQDTPKYGRWLPVEIEGEDAFLLLPGELIEELQEQDAEPGETYEVTRCEKAGPQETDPWEVNVESQDEGTQTRL